MKQLHGVLVPADNRQPVSELLTPADQLAAAIGARTWAPVRTWFSVDGQQLLLVVDEDGLPRNLPYNHRATLLAGQALVGDVLVLTEVDAVDLEGARELASLADPQRVRLLVGELTATYRDAISGRD